MDKLRTIIVPTNKNVFVIMVLIIVCIIIEHTSSVKSALFINVKPTIQMEDVEYVVTMDVVSKSEIDKQVGKVTKVIELVSYSSDKDNPYRNIGKIYKIKGKDTEDEVALEMNSKLHIAKFNGRIKGQ